MAAIVFRRGAGVQRDGRAPLLLRDVAGFHERLMAVIDADADLGGNGDVRRRAHLHHALNDLAEQVGLQRADAFALSTAENDDSGRVKLVQRQRGEQLVDVQLHDDFAKWLHGVKVNKIDDHICVSNDGVVRVQRACGVAVLVRLVHLPDEVFK